MSKKKILIAGGTGLIGNRIVSLLDHEKYDIHILSRSTKENRDNIKYFKWDVNNREIDLESLKVNSIINLTGAGIADKRWSNARKKVIINSRINSTNLLISGLKDLDHKVESVACASAIGYYGDRADELLYEESAPGTGFMADCCNLWEKTSVGFQEVSDRVSILRVGIVLSTKGGALPKVMMTAPMRVLNFFGNGRQYYSWIHIDDISNCFINCIEKEEYSGVFNATVPIPLSNKEFTRKIGNALGGNYMLIPAPALGLKLALGQMAEVVMNSNRVIPQQLLDRSFNWEYPDLENAIKHLRSTKT